LKARLGKVLNALGASLWFVPSLLALAAAAVSLGLIEWDRRIEPQTLGIASLLFHGGPEGARAVLSALVSSMMTVTGVTFSVTVVALTLASQQYTPRLLRHFAADRVNQIVLGTFIGTFVYCLLVLRTVRSENADGAAGPFVPQIAVTGGVVLAIASLALLIYFIHHVAAAIQPSNIISSLAQSTHELIDHLFPEQMGEEATVHEAREEGLPDSMGAGGLPIPAAETGYLQAVDVEALLRLAGEKSLLVRMERAIGDFVPRGATLATAWPQPSRDNRQGDEQGGEHDRELARRINRCFAFGCDRTMQQDPEYGVIQLSDIAVKALSPGINDPTTALTCLDFLGTLLRHMAAREMPSPLRKDDQGRLRVITRGTDFGRMTDLALSSIRHYGESSAPVTLRLLETLREVAAVLPPGSDREEVLRCHLREIAAGAERGISSSAKRAQIEQALRRAEESVLGVAPGAAEPAAVPDNGRHGPLVP
jgi:uncharacterized membrane protein